MRRKQLNVTLSPEQYAAVQEAAAGGGGEKVATHCREAILARAMPEPPDVARVAGLAAALPDIRHQG